jgi:transposase-like protein
MKIQTAVREIEKMKRKIASLEASVEKASAKKLKSDRKRVAAFVKKLGYKTVDHLFAAISGKAAVVKAAPVKTRKRAKITAAIRKSIVADLKRGGMTAGAAARKHGVSVPTIGNIKKSAGLTRSRKAKKKAVKRTPVKRKAVRKATRKKAKVAKPVAASAAPLAAGSTAVPPLAGTS